MDAKPKKKRGVKSLPPGEKKKQFYFYIKEKYVDALGEDIIVAAAYKAVEEKILLYELMAKAG